METSPDRTSRRGGHARSGPLLRVRDADAAPPQHRAPVTAARRGTRARPGQLSPRLLAAGAAGVAALLVGATAVALNGDERPPSAGPRPAASSASSGPAVGAVDERSPAVAAATGPGRTVADARAALQEQLSARAEGMLLLLRGTWEGDEPAAARGTQRVAASSDGLSTVLAAWLDADVASRIRTGLDQQSESSRAYAAAVASGDVPAADQARARMGEVSRALGEVLAGVTDGRIADYVPPQDAAQYRAFVDALAADDAARADEAATWLRGRLSREGAALAGPS